MQTEHIYTCQHCTQVFRSDRSHAEAAAEYAQTFGAGQTEPAVICDTCYQKIMAWANTTPEGAAVLAQVMKDGGQ